MAKQYIKIRGANEHNLKNVSLDIPRNELVVLTGLSGSGKSSLAFDTIYAEGQRRILIYCFAIFLTPVYTEQVPSIHFRQWGTVPFHSAFYLLPLIVLTCLSYPSISYPAAFCKHLFGTFFRILLVYLARYWRLWE